MGEKNQKFVLITGSGAGFGKHLAEQLASHGYNLALASLLPDELEHTKAELQGKFPKIAITTFAVDMLQPGAHLEIHEWVEKENLALCGLVNNVGFGYSGEFEKFDTAFLNKLLQLNVVFTHNITHVLSPNLIANAPGFILNVASMAAFFPLPYKTVYAASKGFVLTFSRALRQEFREKGVNVSCVTPGPMITNDGVRERIKNIGWRKYIVNISEPEDIARVAMQGILKNKAVIVPTFTDKLNLVFKAIVPPPLLPGLLRRLSKNSF